MPNICLNANEKDYKTYQTGNKKFTVSKHSFNKSNMFIFYKHTPDQELEIDNICAYKVGVNSGSINIKRDGSYENYPVSCVNVYFNKYDDKYKYPLVLLLHFSNSVKAPSRYYAISKFDKDKTSEFKISDMLVYLNEEDLFGQLINENENFTEFLTYDIGMPKNVNIDIYNNNKITISPRQEVFRKYQFNSNEFYKYTHRPFKTNMSHQYKSLITYNNCLFKTKYLEDQMIDLEEIQVQNYKSVNVYFGSKAKITSSKGNIEENVPLMVELVKLDKPKQCEYYCHHQNKKGLYWEKLDVFNYEKYTGIKLKVPNRLGNLTKNSTHFLRLLKRLESYFLKTLVIMINKQKLYKNLDVLVSYDDYNKSRIINGIGDLPVTDTTQLKNCLENTGFKVFEHDLSHFELNYESYQLKFIIPSTYNMSKYNEITLNSSNNSRYENIENLNYQSGNGEDNIQVYFYDKDPRPLLVSFGEKGFRPRNKDKYSTEWVAIEDFDDYSEGDGVSLLKHLSEVVGFLNEVNICEHSDNYYNGSDYEIHTYDNTRIYLNVTRVYFDCYIKYEHRPKIDQGYRLGNIVYKKENKKKGYIIYNYTIPLIQVNVYYYNNDIKHSYPLLVELEFKNNDDSSLNRSKLHYKLLKSDFHVMNWEIDHNASRIADQRQKLREHLDLVKHSFDNVPELKGFINNCGHNHLLNPTFLNKSYITRSHGTDDSAHGSSSSYEDHVRSDSSHARSHSPRREVLTINHQQGGMQSSQHVHGNQAPPESGVEKATRIASTVGTFAIAGTGTGVAIYKYSHWIINLFKRLF